MIKFKKNNKTFSLTNEQFLLTQEINNLGFVTNNQLKMLLDIIKGQSTKLTDYFLNNLIIKNPVISRINKNDRNNNVGQVIYTVSSTGRACLKQNKLFVRDPQSFRINYHNMEANETLIQSLHEAAFKQSILGSNSSSLVLDDEIASMSNSLENSFATKSFPVLSNPLNSNFVVKTRLNEKHFENMPNASPKAQNIANALLVGGVRLMDPQDNKKIRAIDEKNTTKGHHFDGNIPSQRSIFTSNLDDTSKNTTKSHHLDGNMPSQRSVFAANLDDTLKNTAKSHHFDGNMSSQRSVFATNLDNTSKNTAKRSELMNHTLIFKPIGLTPYKVNDTLSSQITMTSTALLNRKVTFNLNHFDIRPFNAQYGLTVTQKSELTDTPFEADTMISFNRGDKLHRVFIELDNRTERIKTQIQKIINYIYYAGQHPEEEILLAIVATDGSLPTKKIPDFQYPEKHLNIMIDKILRTRIGEDNVLPNGTIQKAPSLDTDLYRRRPNLKIIFSGVSEAPLKIAEFINNANHNNDYLVNALDLAKRLSKETNWKVVFKPVVSLLGALKQPNAFVDTGLNKFHFKFPKTFGHYLYENTQTNLKLIQPVIAGEEYDLDTPSEIFKELSSFQKNQVLIDGEIIPPMVIYPTRERITHPLIAPSLKKYCNWSEKFIAGQVYYYLPRLGLDNNPSLLFELRELATRFHKDIYNYFTTGYLTKYDAKKKIDYGTEYLPLTHPLIIKEKRSYQELHKLTTEMKSKEFSQQVMLTEIPIGVFKKLIARTQGREFGISPIARLPYMTEVDTELDVPAHIDLNDCLLTPNKQALRLLPQISLY